MGGRYLGSEKRFCTSKIKEKLLVHVGQCRALETQNHRGGIRRRLTGKMREGWAKESKGKVLREEK